MSMSRVDTPISVGQIWREVDTKRRVRVLSVDAVGNPTIQTCSPDGAPLPNRRPTVAAYYRFATMMGTRTGADFLLVAP